MEQILCFPNKILEGKYDKFVGLFQDEPLWRKIKRSIVVLPRDEVEEDYRYRQIIVYVLIRYHNEYLQYKRTKKTEERRLQELYSIGIGGHVNIGDNLNITLFSENEFDYFLSNAIFREINEELRLDSRKTEVPQFIGFLIDNSDSVGKVHFGVVSVIELLEKKVYNRKEKGIGSIEFVDLKELEDISSKFENWSKLVINYLNK